VNFFLKNFFFVLKFSPKTFLFLFLRRSCQLLEAFGSTDFCSIFVQGFSLFYFFTKDVGFLIFARAPVRQPDYPPDFIRFGFSHLRGLVRFGRKRERLQFVILFK